MVLDKLGIITQFFSPLVQREGKFYVGCLCEEGLEMIKVVLLPPLHAADFGRAPTPTVALSLQSYLLHYFQ